ncbi:MAG: hypothetical protein WCI92_00585 [Bacteroidota bacterium]
MQNKCSKKIRKSNFYGVVARTIVANEDKFILFMLDPDTGQISDGVNISDHKNVYVELKYNHIMVVNVDIKDGTSELDNVDLDEFVHGDKYDKSNIFLHIQDIVLYGVKDKIMDIINNRNFDKIALDCISKARAEKEIIR